MPPPEPATPAPRADPASDAPPRAPRLALLLALSLAAGGLAYAASGRSALAGLLGAGAAALWLHARRLRAHNAALARALDQAQAGSLRFEAMVQESAGIVMESQACMAAEIRRKQKAEEEMSLAQACLQETNARLLDAVDRANVLALSAEAANEAKGNFLATMSHEIRTPLNAVLGTADLLLEDELTPAQRGSLETIRSAGNGLLTILNDVLDFSRIESGRLDLENIPLSPAQCVRETLQLHFGRAQARRLRLFMTVADDVPAQVTGDAGRVRQILANLVGNAIKFTRRGEVEVSVSRRPYAAPGKLRLRFSVRDTGEGIPHEKQALLFKPFSQLDASTKRRHGGTGLGLALCRRLAELMDGEMSLESTVGAGSVFHCDIVVGEAKAPTAPPPAPPPSSARSLVTRILVVDDERINLQIATAMLGKLGHRADTARGGLEAMEALRARDYEVVLMDWHMPDMNGLDVTRALRAELDPARQPWVVAVTASALPEDRDACIAAGMNDYLTKPLGLDALREAFVRYEACESRPL